MLRNELQEILLPMLKLPIEETQDRGIHELVVVTGRSSVEDCISEIQQVRELGIGVRVQKHFVSTIVVAGKNRYTIVNSKDISKIGRGMAFNSIRFIK
ncbi:hypothetical protein [Vagococcus fluvialis]|uniref:hypothetical protein n=1 Tax=Vagococcus fluvialis TaxID=2738 RepID=UPI001D0BC31E|nr:hypothetical protein [Vagococcus fluvialis]UDM72646.1 hypothetical protein K5L00_14760 [Vagococcus fluvialis]UDM78369.1 hypothetical protein K5K98_14965 [Vagococcus fluvialis]UDM83921.1 hypothetical protein K5K96_14785 [Vagococcus fluvialis]